HNSNFSDGYRKGFGYGLGVRTIDNGEFCEFGWAGAAGANIMVDCKNNVGLFYAHHMLNPQEDYYEPRLRRALYDSING
ncbi:MAG: hypothetical protein J6I80_00345, partial [Clostridia bacterium]|nr:hypothetical protein [Clostridia bacterium]